MILFARCRRYAGKVIPCALMDTRTKPKARFHGMQHKTCHAFIKNSNKYMGFDNALLLTFTEHLCCILLILRRLGFVEGKIKPINIVMLVRLGV